MEMPQDDGSIKRNALQRIRDGLSNQMLDAEALQNTMEQSNPMLAQIREGAVSGGVMPVASGVAASKKLAEAVKGRLMTPNMGSGAIIKDAAQPLISEAQTMLANAKPKLDPKSLMDIYRRIGMK